MKKTLLSLSLLLIAFTTPATLRSNSILGAHNNARTTQTTTNDKRSKSEPVYQSIRQQYAQGKISADSVIGLALYHKTWSPALAERCFKLVSNRGAYFEACRPMPYGFGYASLGNM